MEHCQTLEFLVYVVYNRIYKYRVNLPCSAVRDFFLSAVLVLIYFFCKKDTPWDKVTIVIHMTNDENYRYFFGPMES